MPRATFLPAILPGKCRLPIGAARHEKRDEVVGVVGPQPMRTVTLALSSVPPARPTPAPGATAATTSARLRPALLSTATTDPISRQAAPRGQPSGMASASAVCFVNSQSPTWPR